MKLTALGSEYLGLLGLWHGPDCYEKSYDSYTLGIRMDSIWDKLTKEEQELMTDFREKLCE